MDYGFKRDRQPWEASDGAVYLLAVLSEVAPQVVGTYYLLFKASFISHF
jgi:hypothetical protein